MSADQSAPKVSTAFLSLLHLLTFSCQAHTAETTKQVNIPKASDDQSTKQEKDNTDPAAAHGEDTGTLLFVCYLFELAH